VILKNLTAIGSENDDFDIVGRENLDGWELIRPQGRYQPEGYRGVCEYGEALILTKIISAIL